MANYERGTKVTPTNNCRFLDSCNIADTADIQVEETEHGRSGDLSLDQVDH